MVREPSQSGSGVSDARCSHSQAPWRALLQRLGLEGKLVLSFGLLLMLALVASSWLSVQKSHGTVSDILGEQVKTMSQTLAMAAATPYGRNDVQQLDQIGRDLLRSRNIVLVVFFDPDGKPLALACRDPDINMQQWRAAVDFHPSPQHLLQVNHRYLSSLGDFLQVTAPVLDVYPDRHADGESGGTRLLGYLAMGISQNHERAELQRISTLSIAAGTLIFVLMLPLVSGTVHRIFLPIRQLVTATDHIAAGDYSARVATDRPDEIGMLARSFNEMALRIRQHEDELRVANEGLAEANRLLEEKVHQRTRELEATNQRLSAEIAEKEDFLRAVSHDLNAPLRNIGGMATILLMKYRDRFDEEIVHRLERICKNVEMETDLIGELLELSRIKTRRQRLEPVDTAALVGEVAGLFEEDLKQRDIRLLVEGGLPVLHCERARMRQVFQNLIDNAIKYMGQGSVREIHVSCQESPDAVEFCVRDTGMGIDPEDAARVFHVFRRGRNTAELKVAGKGVGLASVKSIIETYEGRIRVESEVGKGSAFCFAIPKKHVQSPAGQAMNCGETVQQRRGAA